jgi:hypothetical protein
LCVDWRHQQCRCEHFIELAHPNDLGVGNRKDLTPFKTQLEYYVDFGPVQVGHGVIGFGVGFGRGIGYLTCSVTPR